MSSIILFWSLLWEQLPLLLVDEDELELLLDDDELEEEEDELELLDEDDELFEFILFLLLVLFRSGIYLVL